MTLQEDVVCKRLRKRGGQAAVEFLLTYGWAFLVMAAVIAGLVSLDPLGAGPSVERCDSTGLVVGCDESTVLMDEEDDSVSLRVENKRSEAVVVENVSVERVGASGSDSSCSVPGTLRPGESREILCYNTSFASSDSTQVEIGYEWYKASVGPEYAKTGSIVSEGRAGDAGLVTDGLVGHWPLDASTRGMTDSDKDGSVNGAPSRVTGRVGEALRFRSRGGYIDAGVQNYSVLEDSLSISAWIQAFDNKDNAGMVGVGDTGTDNRCLLRYVSTDAITFLCRAQGTSDVNIAHPVSKREWIHVVGTVAEDGNATLYVNGAKKGSEMMSLPFTGFQTMKIANDEVISDVSHSFNGTVDDIRIYERALSSEEVSSLYRKQS